MEIIKKEILLEKNTLSQMDSKTLFFDIETLGLSSKYNPIYLIGAFSLMEEAGVITLFFANNTDEEKQIINEFYRFSKQYKKIVTFNGESFDIPFVRNRALKYDIDFDFNRFESIDIYKKIKPLKKILSLDRLNQKSLEEFCGLFREDKYDGGKLINIYKEYEQNPCNELKELLLLHNFEDVKGMLTIYSLLSYYQLKNSEFDEIEIDTTDLSEIVFKYSLKTKVPKSVRILLDGFHAKVYEDIIVGTISTSFCEKKCFMAKPNDYVYLPMEDMIIPKSLASSIPKDRKEKATKENCYVKSSGSYFKIPDYKKFKSYYNFSDTLLYKDSLGDCNHYIKIDSSEKSELSILIKSLLKFSF